jgi:hypothetical protein
MKAKLLKKLRRRGRSQITIHSVTTSCGTPIGISYGYNDDMYSGLFDFGDTEEIVLKKAEKIYIKDWLKQNHKQ